MKKKFLIFPLLIIGCLSFANKDSIGIQIFYLGRNISYEISIKQIYYILKYNFQDFDVQEVVSSSFITVPPEEIPIILPEKIKERIVIPEPLPTGGAHVYIPIEQLINRMSFVYMSSDEYIITVQYIYDYDKDNFDEVSDGLALSYYNKDGYINNGLKELMRELKNCLLNNIPQIREVNFIEYYQ
ncbi:MAG: hypothetical protein LBI28_14095 [Treponema sp.]|jgi:hypothetical protein|nr:hypothetical protein [Treponema sp.]